MKKKIVSLAILMTMGVFVYANNAFTSTSNENTTVLVQDDGYKTVEISELPETIQAVIKAYEEFYIVESAAYNASESLTKLSLVSKADESKKEVILDAEGKDLEAEAAVEPAPEN